MATIYSLPNSANDMRECSVCLEDMLQKSPELLECKHSFCTQCLSALAEAHADTSDLKVSCPKCKHNTIIKSGKLSDLPDNFLLLQLKTALEQQTSCNYCFYCSLSHIEAIATSLCNTCCGFMCNNCSEKHRKRFAKHEITIIMKEKQQEFCQKHNRIIVYVCSACSPKRLLCDVCMMLDDPCHGDEHLLDYTIAMSQGEEDLRSKLDQQCNADDVLSKFENIVQKEMSEVQENVGFIKQGLDSLVQKATSQIEESLYLQKLRLAANDVKACRMKALTLLDSEVKQLDGIHAITEEMTKALKTFSEKETKTEAACKNVGSDPRFLEKLVNIKQCLSYVLEYRKGPISCWPTEGTVSKLRATKVGRVVYVCQGNPVITEITPDGIKRKLQIQHTPHIDEDLSIDIFDNNMYITCHNNSDRSAYLYKCDLSTDFNIPFPFFSQMKPSTRFRGWSVADTCICNTKNIMIIRAQLHRYDQSSDTVKDFQHPFDNECIQLTSVKVDGYPRIIATYVTTKAILLLDNEGNTIQTISQNGCPFKQPRATTINTQGNVLVADFETCKIVEITLKGELVRDVLTKEDGLGSPTNVTYSHPYLWVADQNQDGKCQLKCYRE